jgi:hypothetical protein
LINFLQTITAFAQPTAPTMVSSLTSMHHRSARSTSTLVHVNGRYAIALVLDGVVLCLVPVGTQATATLQPS